MSLSLGWGDELQDERPRQGVVFLHVPAQGFLRCVVLSEEPTSYKGHYVAGAMRLCEGGDCPLCARGVGSQVRVVFAVWDLGLQASGLLELSAGAASELRELAEGAGALRGLPLSLFREGGHARGRVVVDRMSAGALDGLDWQKIPVPDVRGHMLGVLRRAATGSFSFRAGVAGGRA
jgi:hypothetical protein